jgi:hypothetical protein
MAVLSKVLLQLLNWLEPISWDSRSTILELVRGFYKFSLSNTNDTEEVFHGG